MAQRPDDRRRQSVFLPIASVLLMVGSLALAAGVNNYRRAAMLSGFGDAFTLGPLQVRAPAGWQVRTSEGSWPLRGVQPLRAYLLERGREGRTIAVEVRPLPAGSSPDVLLDTLELPANVRPEERWRSTPIANGYGFLATFVSADPFGLTGPPRKLVLVAGVTDDRYGITVLLDGRGRPADADAELAAKVAAAIRVDRSASSR